METRWRYGGGVWFNRFFVMEVDGDGDSGVGDGGDGFSLIFNRRSLSQSRISVKFLSLILRWWWRC